MCRGKTAYVPREQREYHIFPKFVNNMKEYLCMWRKNKAQKNIEEIYR